MPVGTTNPRVTAADPGAWLDGEPWTFTLTFTDPDQATPTDLTGSRLYVQFQAQGPAGLVAIQICDSEAGDGSLVIEPGAYGQATFNAVPEARTWTAPRYGPGLLLLPALVFGDVYRQVGFSDPTCLTRLTLRVLPTTGAPGLPTGPAPKALVGRISGASALIGDLSIAPVKALVGSIPAGSGPNGSLSIAPSVALAGGIVGAGTLTGAITKTGAAAVTLSGAISGTGALTGALTVAAVGTAPLAGGIAGSGGPSGILTVAAAGTSPLTGSIPGGGSISGALSVVPAQPLVGAISGAGGLTGALTVAAVGASPLTGSILGSGSPTGALSVVPAQPLTGAVSGAGGPTGALTVTAPTGLVQARKGRLAAAMAA
jgi:hypothetical protein